MAERGFAELLEALTVDGPAPAPEQLCRRCAQAFGVDGCSLAVLAGGQVATAATWGALAAAAEAVQELVGEGPGVAAAGQWRPQLVADVASSPRFVAFSAAAGAGGPGSAYAFPVGVGAVRLAVLTLFDSKVGALGPAAFREAVVAADVVAWLLLGGGGEAVAEQLVSQPSSVHRASGMVAAQVGCTVEEALGRMRARALADQVGLEQLAGMVLRRELRFDGGA